MMKPISASVPQELYSIFNRAEQQLSGLFKHLSCSPLEGTISIENERYLLVRASSLSIDFFNEISLLFEGKNSKDNTAFVRQILFDIAHAMGKKDAKFYIEKLGLKTPEEKLAVGPIFFAYSGWAFVDIFPESKPSPDDDFLLLYSHPYSFEADSWIKSNKKPDYPACIMNAGYSSGWCEECFDIDLVASEVCCKALGDDECRFVMAPPDQIRRQIENYIRTLSKKGISVSNFEIPEFFKLKKIQDELKKSNEFLKEAISSHKENEKMLRYLVDHDALTGLYNRNKFLDEMSLFAELCSRHQTKAALLYMDINAFKEINDTMGHTVGDGLLKEFSSRLKLYFRKSDIIARLGGDEFVVMIYNFKSVSTIEKICKDLSSELSQPYKIKERLINTSVSIGVSIYPDDCDSLEDWVEHSDSAMYQAKNSKEKDYTFYNSLTDG